MSGLCSGRSKEEGAQVVDIDGIGEATATGSSWSGGGGRMFLVCGWIEDD